MPLSHHNGHSLRKFTEEEAFIATAFLERSPWGGGFGRSIVPELCDELPPVNSKGGRDAVGWRAVFSGTVEEYMCNPLENLHGGCTASIIDTVSSAAIAVIATSSFWGVPMLSGVSITLDTKYFDPAPLGAKMRIAFEIERMTPTLCTIRAEITDWDTGRRFASGSHTKAWRPAKKAKL